MNQGGDYTFGTSGLMHIPIRREDMQIYNFILNNMLSYAADGIPHIWTVRYKYDSQA